VREAFLHGIDLFSPPKKAILRLLAEYASKPEEKEALINLCSAKGERRRGVEIRMHAHCSLTHIAGSKLYMDEIVEEHTGLAELLLDRFPSSKPPFGHLLSVAAPLQPRYFSMANSPLAHPNIIRFAFSVVRYTTAKGKRREGLCTTWLEQLSQHFLNSSSPTTQVHLKIFFRPTRVTHILLHSSTSLTSSSSPQDFVVPQDMSRPIVMVGPGTGVAPFIGFLEHRAALDVKSQGNGDWWLFFGCRHETKDYLYR